MNRRHLLQMLSLGSAGLFLPKSADRYRWVTCVGRERVPEYSLTLNIRNEAGQILRTLQQGADVGVPFSFPIIYDLPTGYITADMVVARGRRQYGDPLHEILQQGVAFNDERDNRFRHPIVQGQGLYIAAGPIRSLIPR